MTYEGATLKCNLEGGNLAGIRNAKSQTIIDRISNLKILIFNISFMALI